MDGLPVTIRLLDPPLHEFLPDLTELSVQVAVAEARGEDARERPAAAAGGAPAARAEPDARPARRPPRPGHPRACSRCRSRAIARGGGRAQPRPAGYPRVGDHGPAGRRRAGARDHARESSQVARRGRARRPACTSSSSIGTMIELPRAALTAGQIAEAAEFFSFGTNDLTQTTWGFSPRRRRGRVLLRLPREGHLRRQPVRDRSTATASARWSGSPSRRAARTARASSSASAASTAATPTRSTSSTRSASTTCPARRSGCRSPGSRPAARSPTNEVADPYR